MQVLEFARFHPACLNRQLGIHTVNKKHYLPVILVLIAEAMMHGFRLFPLSIHLGQGAVPWLMAHNRVLYQTILEHRPPLTAWMVYAVQPLFQGDSLLTVLVLHTLLVMSITLLVFWLAQRTMIPYAGTLAIVYYALLNPVFNPVAFYFEVVQGLFYGVVLLLIMKSTPAKWELFWAGVMLGLAFFTKQQAVVVSGWVLVWTWWNNRTWRDTAACAAGIALPVIVIWGGYVVTGRWDDYYYWNFTFNVQHGQDALLLPTGDFLRRMILTQGWLFPLALMALKQRNKSYWLLVGIGLAAQATQYPRSSELHAGAALPVVSIAFGIVAASLLPKSWNWREWTSETLLATSILALVLAAILTNVATRFIPSPAGFQAILGQSEFDGITAWLDDQADQNDTLYILPASDSTAQLHPLTGLAPPGTWAIGNQYGHAPPFVTERLLAEWQIAPPTWLIWFPAMTDEVSPVYFQSLFDFMEAHYKPVMQFDDLPFYGDAIVYRVTQPYP